MIHAFRAVILCTIVAFGLTMLVASSSPSLEREAQGKKKADAKKGKGKAKGKEKPPPPKIEKPKDTAVKVMPLHVLKGHKSWVNSVDFSTDGKHIVSAGRDRVVIVWNASNAKEEKKIEKLPTDVKGAVFLPKSMLFVTTTGAWDKKKKAWEGEIKVIDASTGKETKSVKGHSAAIEDVAVSGDGQRIATGSEDKTVIIWDAKGKPVNTIKGFTEKVFDVALNGDGSKVATASSLEQKKTEKKGKKVTTTTKEVGEVKVWDVKTGKALLTLDGFDRAATCVAFSRDNKQIAAGSYDGTIKIWDVNSGKEIRTIKSYDVGVLTVAFSPDGKTLASGGWDKAVRLWNVADGKEIFAIQAHGRSVSCLAFSPDGQQIASGGLDELVKIWSTTPPKK